MKYHKIIAGVGAATIALMGAMPAFALHNPEHYSLFGDAAYVSPGNATSSRAVEVSSDAASTTPYGGIDYGVESGLTFGNLTQLSTDYMFTASSTCGGGSPRYQINVFDPVASTTGNIFVYLGAGPNYDNCQTGVWLNTGNLLGTSSASTTVDTSQLPGGTFYSSMASATAMYGNYTVTGIQFVADAGWMFPNGQSVVVDNTLINSTLFTYEVPVVQPPAATVPTTRQECMNGGWRNLADANGHTFKNQGDCVSYVSTHGRNPGAGQSPSTTTPTTTQNVTGGNRGR
jgi:hypothetical protein